MTQNTQEPLGTQPNLLLNIVIKWRKGAKQIPKVVCGKKRATNMEKKRMKTSLNEGNVTPRARNTQTQ